MRENKRNMTNAAEIFKNQMSKTPDEQCAPDKPVMYSFEETESSEIAEAAEEYVLSRYRKEGEELAPRLVSEALAEYARTKVQGKYTLEDYLALPEERCVELIDGVIYDMASPTYIHQDIASRIWRSFADYIDKKHGQCWTFAAPVDVQLDSDDKTIIQPDVMIVCDRSKLRKGRVYGAPDLVVEVLSPSTSKKDECVII